MCARQFVKFTMGTRFSARQFPNVFTNGIRKNSWIDQNCRSRAGAFSKASDNAELKIKKKGDSSTFLKNRSLCSALSITRHNVLAHGNFLALAARTHKENRQFAAGVVNIADGAETFAAALAAAHDDFCERAFRPHRRRRTMPEIIRRRSHCPP